MRNIGVNMESGSKIKKFISIYFTVSAILYLVIAATIGNLYFFLSGVFMALPMIGPFRNFLVKDTFNKLGYKAKINTHTTSYIN